MVWLFGKRLLGQWVLAWCNEMEEGIWHLPLKQLNNSFSSKCSKEKSEGIYVIIKRPSGRFEKGTHTKLSIRMGFLRRESGAHGVSQSNLEVEEQLGWMEHYVRDNMTVDLKGERERLPFHFIRRSLKQKREDSCQTQSDVARCEGRPKDRDTVFREAPQA